MTLSLEVVIEDTTLLISGFYVNSHISVVVDDRLKRQLYPHIHISNLLRSGGSGGADCGSGSHIRPALAHMDVGLLVFHH